MHPAFSSPQRRRLLAVYLLAALAAVTASSTSAQGLPGLKALSPQAPAPVASQPSEADWTARLEAARVEHRRLLDQPTGSAPLLGERQMASARRLVLLADGIEGLRGAAASGPSKAADPATAPVQKLVGSPPFSVIELDALRDRQDVLVSQQAALQARIRSLDETVEAALQARRAAEAALRLRRDQAAGRTLTNADDEAQARLELAQLHVEVTELEVIQADNARKQARTRLALLDESIADLRSELDRAGSEARLDDAELGRMLKGIEAERERLRAEGARFAERLARHDARSPAGDDWRSRMAQPLHQALQMNGDIEALLRGQENLWRGRQMALAAQVEAPQKQAVAQRLTRLAEELQSHQQRLAGDERLLRPDLRAQQALVDGLPAADPTRSGEVQVLDALKTQLDVQDRLRDTLDRTQVLMQRVRAELGERKAPADAGEGIERARAWFVRWITALWQYELFSATETTQIDGRSVTVDHGVTVGKSIGMLLVLAFGYWASGRLARLLVAGAGRSMPISAQLARVLTSWINWILLLAVVLLVLRLARIPLTAFAFLGGALAIGFGFGAQNVIKNLISGVIILFERKVRVGDIVTVGGMSGIVTTVDLRATTVRGFDGIDAIVPNSTLLENQLNNWSGGSPDVRRTIAVGVAYGSDIRRAAQLVLHCATGNPDVLAQPPADVLFEDFGADSLLLRLRYWTRLDGPRGGSVVDSDLRFAIHDALAEAGIVIAFPQRDVHLDMAAPLRVELTAAAADRLPATPAPPG
jgi:potassium efflux system protein